MISRRGAVIYPRRNRGTVDNETFEGRHGHSEENERTYIRTENGQYEKYYMYMYIHTH